MSLDLINACRGGEAVAACFSAPRLLTHLLAFEVALAESEAALGLIPASAVQPIRDCAQADAFDLAALVLATRDSMTPVIPFVLALTAMVEARDPQAARYVHFGATSQDVIDSAVMLAARAALQLLASDLRALMTTLATLAQTHRSTLITARSLSQHAGPHEFRA